MPRSTREWARRKIDNANNNINWAGRHLQEVIETYKRQHPEISDPIIECQKMMLYVTQILDRVKSNF